MHAQRVLHRDLKAENLFCDGHGAVKVGDLGLGRLLSEQSSHARTGVGTPLYFSPEMCEERPYNAKSDIWALGCLAYELCALRPPFLAANQLALARKIMHATPHPLPPQLQLLSMHPLSPHPLLWHPLSPHLLLWHPLSLHPLSPPHMPPH